jgi:hypothetical protein
MTYETAIGKFIPDGRAALLQPEKRADVRRQFLHVAPASKS